VLSEPISMTLPYAACFWEQTRVCSPTACFAPSDGYCAGQCALHRVQKRWHACA